jgi:hypothetical protein
LRHEEDRSPYKKDVCDPKGRLEIIADFLQMLAQSSREPPPRLMCKPEQAMRARYTQKQNGGQCALPAVRVF